MSKTRKSKPGKLGRNDPCFCGSGIKYKKCCLPKGLTPPKIPTETSQEVLDAYEDSQARTAFLNSKGIYINMPNTIVFKGKTFLAAGNKVMFDDNPHATFSELLLRNLQLTLGKEWWEAESAKPVDQQHYVRRCYEELKNNPTRDDLDIKVADEHTRSMLMTGDTQALMSLAFDVYLLTHKNYMPEEWVDRLRNREEFQGVRYEIGVASLFVRMGCELEFYDPKERDKNGKRPKRAEFIAIHSETGNRVAVEAKSRQRDGVLHHPGTPNYNRAVRGKISDLYKQALLKQTDGLPLIVFIDVNSPTEVDATIDKAQWYADVRRSFESRPEPSPENPDKHTALFVTNYSPHYQGDNVSASGQYLYIGSIYPAQPLADGHTGTFMQKLLQATTGYGYVPPSMDNSKMEIYKPPTVTSKEDFVEKLRQLTMPKAGDPEYAKREAECNNLIEMLVWDATQKSGDRWNNEIATECYNQFEWLYKHP
jgi:hypothetical protein